MTNKYCNLLISFFLIVSCASFDSGSDVVDIRAVSLDGSKSVNTRYTPKINQEIIKNSQVSFNSNNSSDLHRNNMTRSNNNSLNLESKNNVSNQLNITKSSANNFSYHNEHQKKKRYYNSQFKKLPSNSLENNYSFSTNSSQHSNNKNYQNSVLHDTKSNTVNHLLKKNKDYNIASKNIEVKNPIVKSFNSAKGIFIQLSAYKNLSNALSSLSKNNKSFLSGNFVYTNSVFSKATPSGKVYKVMLGPITGVNNAKILLSEVIKNHPGAFIVNK